MKKISTFFLFSTISVLSNAQEGKIQSLNSDVQERRAISHNRVPLSADINNEASSKEVKLESTPKTTTISIRAGESQITHDRNYYENEIAKIDSQIAAINTKIDIVQANPEEKALANESGWFNDMDNIKNQLEAKKQELQSHLN